MTPGDKFLLVLKNQQQQQKKIRQRPVTRIGSRIDNKSVRVVAALSIEAAVSTPVVPA